MPQPLTSCTDMQTHFAQSKAEAVRAPSEAWSDRDALFPDHKEMARTCVQLVLAGVQGVVSAPPSD